MIRSLRAALAALLLGSVSLLASCKDDVTAGAPPSAPASIKIGVVLGKSGSSAASADDILTGIHVAEYQINSLGGVDGRQIEFLVEDDADDEGDKLAGILEGFIQQGVIGVLGPIRSRQVIAAKDTVAGRVALISPSATAASLSDLNDVDDPWIFRTIPNDNLQVKAMVKFAHDGLAGKGGGCSKMAIVYADDDYGQGLDEGLADAFPEAGSGLSVGPRIALGEEAQADYSAEVDRLAAANPDCMALIAVQDVGGQFMISLGNARAQDSTLFSDTFFVIGADGLYNQGFLDQAKVGAANRAEGVFGTVAASPVDWGPLLEFLVMDEQFTPGVTASNISSYVAGSYDAAMLLILARAYAGSDDPTAVRDAVIAVSKKAGDLFSPNAIPTALTTLADGTDIDYNGASGPVDIQSGGDVLSGFLVWTVTSGKFATVGNYESTELSE